jgi:hypothetical protein
LKVKQMQDAKWKVKIKSSAHKNKSLSATLPGSDAKKVLDNPQVQGITVAPSQSGSMSVDPLEQEGKAITLSN